jgi:hypothetical protein
MNVKMLRLGGLTIIAAVILIYGAGLVANSILPLAVAMADTTFTVKRVNTESGVSNCRIDLYQHGFFGYIPANPTSTIYTSSSGIATGLIPQGEYTVKFTAQGYVTKQQEYDIRGDIYITPSYVVTLTPDSTPSTGQTVTLYIDNFNGVWVRGQATLNGVTVAFNANGEAAKAVFTSVPEGVQTVHVWGDYKLASDLVFPTYNYSKTISVSNIGLFNTFTVQVQNGEITEGKPQERPFDMLKFLMVNWWYILMGLLALLVLRR